MEAALNREEMIHSNPLLFNTGDTLKRRYWMGVELSWRWDDDVVFRNQGKTEKKPKRFINDTIRNDFHVNFMNTVFRQWGVCFDTRGEKRVGFVWISGMGYVGCSFIRCGSSKSILIACSIAIPISSHFPPILTTFTLSPSLSNKQVINQSSLTPSNAAEHTQHASPRRPGTT